MAEEANAEAGGDLPAEESPSKLPLILGAVNTLFVLAAAGTLVYTRVLFKRPQITEDSERARIEEMKSSPTPMSASGYVNFEPMTINIASNVPQEGSQAGQTGQIQGKLHYATIGFSLELTAISRSGEIDAIKPLILDQFLGLVGRKQFQDLTSIEGRYILKTQLIEAANELAKKHKNEGAVAGAGDSKAKPPAAEDDDDSTPLVSNLYFNQFIVQ